MQARKGQLAGSKGSCLLYTSACAINDLLTLEPIGKFDAWEKTGVIPKEQLDYYKHNACPSCGVCSFMGTASTMQIMAEALGLMLPGTALMPATAPELKQAAYEDVDKRQGLERIMELISATSGTPST